MKILYSIIAIFILSSYSFGQSGVKIVTVEDGTDYTSGTITFEGSSITVGAEFYVINTSSTTNTYRYGVLPVSVSDTNFKFQFCELAGGDNPGLCYNVMAPIGTFWLAPTIMNNIAPGDTMKVDIKMNTFLEAGTGKAVYYVLNGHQDKLDSITTLYTSTASLDKQEMPSFNIYPNPAKDMVTIQGEGLKDGGTVVFRNTLGQEVKRVQLSEMHTMINVSSLNRGVYFVNIVNNQGAISAVRRLIKQ